MARLQTIERGHQIRIMPTPEEERRTRILLGAGAAVLVLIGSFITRHVNQVALNEAAKIGDIRTVEELGANFLSGGILKGPEVFSRRDRYRRGAEQKREQRGIPAFHGTRKAGNPSGSIPDSCQARLRLRPSASAPPATASRAMDGSGTVSRTTLSILTIFPSCETEL